MWLIDGGFVERPGSNAVRFILETGKMLRHHLLDASRSVDDEDGVGPTLSVEQLRVSILIRDRGPLTMTELAGALKVSAPSASMMVDRLVEKGVLVRTQSREDRRKVLVSVSPEAQARMDARWRAVEEAFFALAETLGDETVEQWYAVMSRVRAALEEG